MSLSRRQMLGFAGVSTAVAAAGGAVAGVDFARRTMQASRPPKVKDATSPSRGPKLLWRLPVTPVIGDKAVTITTLNDTVYLLSGNAVRALAAESGRTVWKYPLSGPYAGDLTFNNGVIYLNYYSQTTNNNNAHIAAIEMRTGRKLWHKVMVNSYVPDPICDGPVVYLSASPVLNGTGHLYALDALSGDPVWQLSGVGDKQTLLGADNTPDVVINVESPIFTKEEVLYTASAYGLHARDKRTGEELWSYTYPEFNSDGGPILSGDRIYIASNVDVNSGNSRMVALDAETGQQTWSSDVLGNSTFSIDISGCTVFALATESGITALSATSGSTAWRKASPTISPYLAVSDDLVVVSGPLNNLDGGVVRPGNLSGETELCALRSADGQMKWQMSSAGSSLSSVPVIAGGQVCVGFSQTSIHVLNSETGKTEWNLPLPVEYGPIATGDIIFAIVADEVSESGNASQSGALYAIKMSS